ncbi:MAG TPA: glycosyltransferase, partial [Gemmataceae bacterium]
MTGDTPQDGLPIASRPHGRVFVQLCTEPYTGLPILAAGGHWPGEPADPPPVAEVRYDGVAKSAAEVRPTGETEPDGRPRLQFSTQLPREANVRRVQVVLREGGREEVLFDAELDTIPSHDAAAAVAPPRGKLAKLLGFLRRGWRSLRTGEIFSLWRWAARARRFRDKLTELRLRLRQKLLARRFRPRAAHDGYAEHTALTPRLREAVRERAGRFAYRPKISILLPVYNVAPKYLREAIESVRAQVYDNWELCIADDASTLPALRRYLRRLPRDPRLKLVRRSRNGHISAASNSAAAAATGEFVALLDHDDRLAPDALYEIVALLQQHPGADLIYSDEDKLDAAGRRYDPQFKPDWSPELLLSYNYINHLTCIRKSVFDAAGRFRLGFEGSQDHDLLLRVIERTDRVFHIPKILYHWRALPSSTASAAGVKPFVHTSGRRALEDYLFRNRLDAEPYVPEFARRLGLPVNLLDWPDEGPSVAVLLLGDGSADLRRCAESVLRRTTYRSYRLVVRTGPRDPEGVRRVLREMAAADPRIDWGHDEDASGPLPARLNRAVAAMTEDLLVFLDPRLEVTEPRWLSRLAGYATLPGVGATGPSVFAADGTRLRAGVVLGMRDGTAPADAFRGLPADAVSYYFYAEVARPVAAVSGACLLTHRRHFDLLGGFDAARFPRSLFDVDYCLRLAERGLR